jgi:hypothetical protein
VANTFLTPSVIARQALANLYSTTVMAALMHRDYEPEFVAHVGDTVTIRKPAVFVGKEFNPSAGIEVQDATETGVPVQLNHFADVSFAITAKQRTLNLQDFNEQLLNPAMEAISQKIDNDCMTVRDDVTAEVGSAAVNAAGEDYTGYNGNYPYSDSRVLIQAGKTLTMAKVSTTERRVVVGPTTAAFWKAEKTWRQANKRGSTEGLLEASLGDRVAGFDPYETQNIGEPAGSPATGAPTTEVNLAFHRTAFALAMRPLELPSGAVNAVIMNYKGFALRVVMDYDITHKQDIVSIDTLYGIKTLDANRAVLIKGADAA